MIIQLVGILVFILFGLNFFRGYHAIEKFRKNHGLNYQPKVNNWSLKTTMEGDYSELYKQDFQSLYKLRKNMILTWIMILIITFVILFVCGMMGWLK